ncbi:hypothetical protein E9993_01475 [Labilibacter sediminis]|nr:hypothetical protein E9993_01475 [Labilibacter sediminis]
MCTIQFLSLHRHSILVQTLFIICMFLVSCSKDDSTDTSAFTSLSFPLNGAFQDIQLVANQPTNQVITLNVPPEIKMLKSAKIDILKTLKNASVSYQKSALKSALINSALQNDETGWIHIKVGDSPETACLSSISYGPYNLSPGFFGAPMPKEVPLDQPSIQIVNTGTVVLCIEMVSAIDAVVSIDEVAFDITQSDCTETFDFSGLWQGIYECENSCANQFGGEIQLTVTQNGTTASYTDDMDITYTGTICDEVFRFERTNEYESESGTLTRIDDNYAIKRSTWRSHYEPYCFGNCVDTLYRISQ